MFLQEVIFIGFGSHSPFAFLAGHLWVSGDPRMFFLEMFVDFVYCKCLSASANRALVPGVH